MARLQQQELHKVTEWPGFSSENYTELQSGLALAEKNYTKLQSGLALAEKNYTKLQNSLALVDTLKYRMFWH